MRLDTLTHNAHARFSGQFAADVRHRPLEGHRMHPATDRADPRPERTRDALRGALIALTMERRYAEIRLDDVLRVAGIGRSTFYEHFRDKDALLISCMEPALACLSALPFDADGLRGATLWLEHVWAMRGRAGALFQGVALRRFRRALILRMASRIALAGTPLHLPQPLAACALADTVLSPVLAWIRGEAWCPADQLASGLQSACRALLAGMSAGESVSTAPAHAAC